MNKIKSIISSGQMFTFSELPKEIRSTIIKRIALSAAVIYLAIFSIFLLKSLSCFGILIIVGCIMGISTLLLARDFMMGRYLIIEGRITDKGQKKSGTYLRQLSVEDGTVYIVTVKQHDYNTIYVTNTVRLYVKNDTSLANNIEKLKINYPPFIFPVKIEGAEPLQGREAIQEQDTE